VDDLGYGDVSWHGGKFKTPNIEQIAKSGARLEQFYVQPLCTPTRAALMTGRYPMRYGLQVSTVRPWDTYGLPLQNALCHKPYVEADIPRPCAASGIWAVLIKPTGPISVDSITFMVISGRH
jgi:hypothetical protein